MASCRVHQDDMKLRADKPASFRISRWRTRVGQGSFRCTTCKQDIFPLEKDEDLKKRIAEKLANLMGQDPHLQAIANMRGFTITAITSDLFKEEDDDDSK